MTATTNVLSNACLKSTASISEMPVAARAFEPRYRRTDGIDQTFGGDVTGAT